MERIILLIDSNRGTYIPQYFAEHFDNWSIDDSVRETLLNPECEAYWYVWDEVLANAQYIDKDGHTWSLYQDGDLWAIRMDLYEDRTSKEYIDFFGKDDDIQTYYVHVSGTIEVLATDSDKALSEARAILNLEDLDWEVQEPSKT